MAPAHTGPIVVGYDDEDAAKRALERALGEAKEHGAGLVVVSVVELPLDPEGPQNFGTLDDSPARMIPLVVPEELEPVLAHARERVAAEGVSADFLWAAETRRTCSSTLPGTAGRRSSSSARTITASSRSSSGKTSPPR